MALHGTGQSGGGGSGTVTSVSVATAAGVSGTVANPTTTPAITVTLGAITPSSVAVTGNVTGANLSGTNTGDQTTVSGNAGSATILQTGRNFSITGGGITASAVSFNGSGAVVLNASVDANGITYAKFQQPAATKLVGNPTGSTANAQDVGLAGGLFFTSTNLVGAVVHPGYVAGMWYCPLEGISLSAGAAIGTGTIKLLPFTLSKPITVSDLGARVTTLSAAGNFQLAIYANNATTARPTGTALCSTGNISTGATGAISLTIGSSVLLAPGTYWMAINQDNGVAVYQTIASSVVHFGYLIGSTTLANVTSAAAASNLVIGVTQTFGTWPDLTSASFTEAANQTSAAVFLKAA